jgi:hypothetical protein
VGGRSEEDGCPGRVPLPRLEAHGQQPRGGVRREYPRVDAPDGPLQHAAALIYQHATSERDREIAQGTDKRIAEQQGKKATTTPAKSRRSKKGDDPDDGTSGDLAPRRLMAREWLKPRTEINEASAEIREKTA